MLTFGWKQQEAKGHKTTKSIISELIFKLGASSLKREGNNKTFNARFFTTP